MASLPLLFRSIDEVVGVFCVVTDVVRASVGAVDLPALAEAGDFAASLELAV